MRNPCLSLAVLPVPEVPSLCSWRLSLSLSLKSLEEDLCVHEAPAGARFALRPPFLA